MNELIPLPDLNVTIKSAGRPGKVGAVIGSYDLEPVYLELNGERFIQKEIKIVTVDPMMGQEPVTGPGFETIIQLPKGISMVRVLVGNSSLSDNRALRVDEL